MTSKTVRAQSAVKALTEKQAVYVDARGRGKGRRTAAAEAGYTNPDANAHKIDKVPAVQEAIEREKANYRLVSGLTRQDVIDGLMDAVNQGKLLSDPQSQIAGWREIAKIHGYYAPEVKKIELTGSQQRKVSQLEALSDQELLEMSNALEGDFVEVVDDE